MIDKIKAEIEEVRQGCKSNQFEKETGALCGGFLDTSDGFKRILCHKCQGKIISLDLCLKWAEECEKEVKALFYNIKDKGYLKLEDIGKAFHSKEVKT